MNLIVNAMQFMFGFECMGCGLPAKLDPWLCSYCVKELERESSKFLKPTIDAYSLFAMNPMTRRLIHALKYKSISGMATYLVRHSSAKFGSLAKEFELLPQPLYFVPVPLHRARFRERGYNQAEKIAAALATILKGKVCKWLVRKTFKVSQTKLGKEKREINVANAFKSALPKNLPKRGTVVIVDDVFTTGATTSACIAAFGKDFPLMIKVCTLLYDEPASAAADFAADCSMAWDT